MKIHTGDRMQLRANSGDAYLNVSECASGYGISVHIHGLSNIVYVLEYGWHKQFVTIPVGFEHDFEQTLADGWTIVQKWVPDQDE